MSKIDAFMNSIEFDLNSCPFCLALWETYKITGKLYTGLNSEIFLMENLKNKAVYTLKAIRKQEALSLDLESLVYINHPQISKVILYGESESFYYTVKPYMSGINLKEHIETNGPLWVNEGLLILKQLLGIFEYLHNMPEPMVYRDLKPANIIVNEQLELTLIDLETTRTLKKEQTSDTFYVGTQGYASPEQYGYSQSDPRSDIYAIGATLYFCMTGVRPGEDHGSRKIHKSLDKIISRCLDFNPKKRYQSVGQLKKALLVRPIRKMPWLASLVISVMLFVSLPSNMTPILEPSTAHLLEEALPEAEIVEMAIEQVNGDSIEEEATTYQEAPISEPPQAETVLNVTTISSEKPETPQPEVKERPMQVATAPEPKPEPAPDPEPKPAPEPAPEPDPEPVPEPVPEPEPAQTPEPTPNLQNENKRDAFFYSQGKFTNLPLEDGHYVFKSQIFMYQGSRINQSGGIVLIQEGQGHYMSQHGTGPLEGKHYSYVFYMDKNDNHILDPGEWYSIVENLKYEGEAVLNINFDQWRVY